MTWWIWILIILGILVFIIFLIKFLTRGKGETSSSNSLLDSAKSRVQKIGDCCKKIGQFFGGGA